MKTFWTLVATLALLVNASGCGNENPSGGGGSPIPDPSPMPTQIQHVVTLTWNASTSTVDGYRIYRGIQSGGPYVLIGSVSSSTLAYKDNTVTSGLPYFYVTTAYAAALESVDSNEVGVHIPSP